MLWSCPSGGISFEFWGSLPPSVLQVRWTKSLCTALHFLKCKKYHKVTTYFKKNKQLPFLFTGRHFLCDPDRSIASHTVYGRYIVYDTVPTEVDVRSVILSWVPDHSSQADFGKTMFWIATTGQQVMSAGKLVDKWLGLTWSTMSLPHPSLPHVFGGSVLNRSV